MRNAPDFGTLPVEYQMVRVRSIEMAWCLSFLIQNLLHGACSVICSPDLVSSDTLFYDCIVNTESLISNEKLDVIGGKSAS